MAFYHEALIRKFSCSESLPTLKVNSFNTTGPLRRDLLQALSKRNSKLDFFSFVVDVTNKDVKHLHFFLATAEDQGAPSSLW